jgi:hypothetical protein
MPTAAPCVLKRAWRKHLQKRASRALAMMMLRAKVRRAHRAAYVSNLLRRKAPGAGSSAASGGGEGSSSVDGAALDEAGAEDEDAVELTVQQEQELQQALQHVLEEGQLSMADIAELQLTDLIQKVTAAQNNSGAEQSKSESESEEEEEEEEQRQAGGWKVLSKPTSPVKVWQVGVQQQQRAVQDVWVLPALPAAAQPAAVLLPLLVLLWLHTEL